MLLLMLACGPSTLEEATSFEDFSDLVQDGALAGLTEVGAPDRGFGPEVVELLCAQDLSRVRVLDLSGNSLTPTGARALAGCELPALRELRLGPGRLHPEGNRLADAGVAALAEAPWWSHLETLGLAHNQIRRLPVLPPGLLRLDLDSNPLEALEVPAGLKVLHAGWMELPFQPTGAALEELILASRPVGDAGALALAASPEAASLRRLYLSNAQIGDAGAQALAGLPAVEQLNLDQNTIGPAGAAAIAAGLPSLKWLTIRDNPLGSEGEAALRARLGDQLVGP